MRPEEIQNELDELWKRVSAGPEPSVAEGASMYSSALPVGDISSMTREASLEAIAYLKKQHNAEILRLRQYIDLKERSVREIADRLKAAEQENVHLKGKTVRSEEALSHHMEEVSKQLEDARKMIQMQESRFREEEKMLRSVAGRTREQLAAETSRWREMEHQWNEREQQYLLDIRELQARAEQAMAEAASHEGRSRQSINDLRDAKTAVEKTLSELLKERQEREVSDKEREKALGRVREVEEHMKELQGIWDEERKQWQELWDRERSNWENQRKEYAKWEGVIQAERKQWREEMGGLRDRESKFHETMAESLRKSSAVGEKVTSMLQFAASKAVDVLSAKPGVAAPGSVKFAAQGRSILPPKTTDWRKLLSAAVAAVFLLTAYPTWKYMHRLRFFPVESHALLSDNPTGISYDGTVLWMSQWDGRLTSLDPAEPSEIIFHQTVAKAGAYHPNAIAIWGESLYTLDTAQGRVLRHPLVKPAEIDSSWPSPGPAPITLTHDGRNLWSYDAATRVVYRHLGEGKDSEAEAYKMELDVLPSAMTWYKDELWVYDVKGRQIMIFKVDGKTLELSSSAQFETPLQSMLLTYRLDKSDKQQLELWGLYVPTGGTEPAALKKYRIKR